MVVVTTPSASSLTSHWVLSSSPSRGSRGFPLTARRVADSRASDSDLFRLPVLTNRPTSSAAHTASATSADTYAAFPPPPSFSFPAAIAPAGAATVTPALDGMTGGTILNSATLPPAGLIPDPFTSDTRECRTRSPRFAPALPPPGPSSEYTKSAPRTTVHTRLDLARMNPVGSADRAEGERVFPGDCSKAAGASRGLWTEPLDRPSGSS